MAFIGLDSNATFPIFFHELSEEHSGLQGRMELDFPDYVAGGEGETFGAPSMITSVRKRRERKW
jgi:hypothetical protein